MPPKTEVQLLPPFLYTSHTLGDTLKFVAVSPGLRLPSAGNLTEGVVSHTVIFHDSNFLVLTTKGRRLVTVEEGVEDLDWLARVE